MYEIVMHNIDIMSICL